MTNVVVDLSSYREKVSSRLAEGNYTVVVDEYTTGNSSAGNQMITLWLRVVDGDAAGAILIDRLVMTEKSLFKVVAFMQALGLPTPRKRLNVNLDAWVGRRLDVSVVDGEPYKGSVKSEVTGYMKATKVAAPAADMFADDALLAQEEYADPFAAVDEGDGEYEQSPASMDDSEFSNIMDEDGTISLDQLQL